MIKKKNNSFLFYFVILWVRILNSHKGMSSSSPQCLRPQFSLSWPTASSHGYFEVPHSMLASLSQTSYRVTEGTKRQNNGNRLSSQRLGPNLAKHHFHHTLSVKQRENCQRACGRLQSAAVGQSTSSVLWSSSLSFYFLYSLIIWPDSMITLSWFP